MTVRVEISEREAEILRALGERLSNAEIAKRYFISVRTVETHVSNLLRKYGAPNRRALAGLAAGSAGPAATRQASGGGGVRGLPVARTPLVGRVVEVEAVTAALGEQRLVTLTGPGGVGKTRLAVTVSEQGMRGAFVDLVPVGPAYLMESVAAALGVAESPGQSLEDAVLSHLGEGAHLLVLDNCEHLVDAAASLAERVVSRCPQTTILATSREPLGIVGEKVFPLGPLPFDSAAPELFAQRAGAADPEFSAEDETIAATVAEICRRLDGMPLAIELAAARSASLGTAGLLAALDDRLRLLTGGRGVDERHRSLRDVVGWSYQLLDDEERRLLRALGIFAGGFDLAAVAAIMPGAGRGEVVDLLGRLTAKSLVTRGRGPQARWRLLETVRVFAVDELRANDEHGTVCLLHLRWAESVAAKLTAQSPDLDLVIDDLRAALAHCPQGTDETAHRLARSLARLTYARRFLEESIAHFRRAATLAPDPLAAAADLERAAASILMTTNLGTRARPVLIEAADRARAGGDRGVEARLLGRAVEILVRYSGGLPIDTPVEEHRALLTRARDSAAGCADPRVVAQLAIAAAWGRRGQRFDLDPERAAEAMAAAQASGDPLLVNAAADVLAAIATRAGRLQEAHRLSGERSLILARLDRDDPIAGPEIVDGLHMAATYAIAAGDLPAALEAGWLVRRDDLIGDHPYSSASKLVVALALCGEVEAALEHAAEMEAGWQRVGAPAAPWLAPPMLAAALAEGLRGDDARSRWWRARALESVRDPGIPGFASFDAYVQARLALHRERFDDASAVAEQSFAAFPFGRHHAYAQTAGAELAVAAGLPQAAELIERARPCARENLWAAACLTRAEARLHGDAAGLERAATMWDRLGARGEYALTLILLPRRAAEGHEILAALGIMKP